MNRRSFLRALPALVAIPYLPLPALPARRPCWWRDVPTGGSRPLTLEMLEDCARRIQAAQYLRGEQWARWSQAVEEWEPGGRSR